MYVQTRIKEAVYGAGENLLIRGSVMDMPAEAIALRGQAQCVYLDPPFMTGDAFQRKRPYGEKGWRRGSPTLSMAGYADQMGEEEYQQFLRRLITESRELLREEGVFYLHLDWRMSARARVLCDEIFGRERFLNEIIWAYQSGGRSKKFFPRKHETILMYAKSKDYFFDLTRVPISRGENRKNHMARKMDENGRMYSSIKSGGKEYRYYDDDPVYPGDVWSDINILQQKDPERTGYPTQKPMKLLERLIRPVTRTGDMVADLCCGSGTTLAAAEMIGCRYLGMDINPEAISVTRARLVSDSLRVLCPTEADDVPAEAEYDPENARLRLRGLADSGDARPAGAEMMDLVERWETGRVEGQVFHGEKQYQRSFLYPALPDSVGLDGKSLPDLMVTDAAGKRRVYQWQE